MPSDEKCLSLAIETDKDGTLAALKSQIIKGGQINGMNVPQT